MFGRAKKPLLITSAALVLLVAAGTIRTRTAVIDEGSRYIRGQREAIVSEGIRRHERRWLLLPWQDADERMEEFLRRLQYRGVYHYDDSIPFGLFIYQEGSGPYDYDQPIGQTHLKKLETSAGPAPKAWGEAVKGLALSLTAGRDSYAASEPFEFTISFRNSSGEPFLYTIPPEVADAPELWVLEARGPEGEVRYRGDAHDVTYILQLSGLEPGAVESYRFAVAEPVWDVSAAGEYAFVFVYEDSGPLAGDTRNIWGGIARSNEVAVERLGVSEGD